MCGLPGYIEVDINGIERQIAVNKKPVRKQTQFCCVVCGRHVDSRGDSTFKFSWAGPRNERLFMAISACPEHEAALSRAIDRLLEDNQPILAWSSSMSLKIDILTRLGYRGGWYWYPGRK